jgi:hypothetical protein
MSKWKRVKDCLVCGRPRCVENEWMIYCFRDHKTYNKKQFQLGVGKVGKTIGFHDRILKDEVLKRGVLEGQSPSKQKALEFEDSEIFEDGL